MIISKMIQNVWEKKEARLMVFVFIVSVVIQILCMSFFAQLRRESLHREAVSYGERIANEIQLSMDNSLGATNALKYLYLQYGEEALEHFDEIAQRIMRDETSIASMYIAPDAVIGAAYPEYVKASTIGYAMLEDPEQGLRAQLAIDTGEITVAGPHELVEGGVGFIIRNPMFENGEFRGFTIIVLDWGEMAVQLLKDVNHLNEQYHFAIWKDDIDETAVTDHQGYILKSCEHDISKTMDIAFEVPNDVWHLTVEPVHPFVPIRDMWKEILISAFLVLLVLYFVHMFIMANEQKNRLAVEMNSNKAKSRFLFSMSHDIRTPMNAIIGYTQLCKKHIDDKEQVEDYLDKISVASDFLLSLINNTLELSRIESGKISLEEAPTDIRSVVDSLIPVFEAEMKAKNLNFVRTVDGLTQRVWADATKLHEIYLNLLSNAVKYTPEGGSITMEVEEAPCEKEGYVAIQAKVSDTGIGMDKNFIPTIFDEFSREHNSTESKIAGSGLGMPIVKQLVDLMEGTILVESTLGEGSVFTVTIPHRIYEQDLVTEEEDSCAQDFVSWGEGKRILLAEDNDLNAEIAIAILEEEGFQVERAMDGQNCVDMYAVASDGFYDLILMDIQMPRMDGYEATKCIRNFPEPKASIPILAMTANAFDEDKRAAFEAGMDDHIAKPIDVDMLMQALKKALG